MAKLGDTFDSTRDLVFFIVRDCSFRQFLSQFCQLLHSLLEWYKIQQDDAEQQDNDDNKYQDYLYDKMYHFFHTFIHNPTYQKAIYHMIFIMDEFHDIYSSSTTSKKNNNNAASCVSPQRQTATTITKTLQQFKEEIKESYQIFGEFTDRNELEDLKIQFQLLYPKLMHHHDSQDSQQCQSLIHEMKRSIIKCIQLYEYNHQLQQQQQEEKQQHEQQHDGDDTTGLVSIDTQLIDDASQYFTFLFRSWVREMDGEMELLSDLGEILQKIASLLDSIVYGTTVVVIDNESHRLCTPMPTVRNSPIDIDKTRTKSEMNGADDVFCFDDQHNHHSMTSPVIESGVDVKSPLQCYSCQSPPVPASTAMIQQQQQQILDYHMHQQTIQVKQAQCITSLYVAQEHLRQMIVPLVKKNLEQISIPSIEVNKPKYTFRLEHKTLNGSDILPDIFDLRIKNLTDDSASKLPSEDEPFCQVRLKATNIQLEIEDLKYYFERHKTPKVEDEGLVDVNLLETGLSFQVCWNVFLQSDQCTIRVSPPKVRCHIDKAHVQVKQSKHYFISRIASKLFARALRKQVASSFVSMLKSSLEPVSEQINAYFNNEGHYHEVITSQSSTMTTATMMTTTALMNDGHCVEHYRMTRHDERNEAEVHIDDHCLHHSITTTPAANSDPVDETRIQITSVSSEKDNEEVKEEEPLENHLGEMSGPSSGRRGRRSSVTISDEYANASPGLVYYDESAGVSDAHSLRVPVFYASSPSSVSSVSSEDSLESIGSPATPISDS